MCGGPRHDTWGDPFTGNGFTKAADDIVPEWQAKNVGKSSTPGLNAWWRQVREPATGLAGRLLSLAGDDGVIPPHEVPVGAPFDHLGNESGHCLYVFDTPMQQRSVPPTDLNEDRRGYVLTGPLPSGATVSEPHPGSANQAAASWSRSTE